MWNIPVWLGAIATLFTLAAVLGAAVAVYRTSIYSTSLRESDASVQRLRGEIGDYKRREAELEGQVALANAKADACQDRCTVLEDLLTHRQDDDVIRAEIAAVREVVDHNVMAQLTMIQTILARIEHPNA
jgi:hypothetical protein